MIRKALFILGFSLLTVLTGFSSPCYVCVRLCMRACVCVLFLLQVLKGNIYPSRGISSLNFLCWIITNFLTKYEVQTKISFEYLSNKTACSLCYSSLFGLIIYISKFPGNNTQGLTKIGFYCSKDITLQIIFRNNKSQF